MTFSARRASLALCLTTAVALSGAATASATTVTNDGGTLTTVAGEGKFNYLELDPSGSDILIREFRANDPNPADDTDRRDEDPIVPAAGSGCTNEDDPGQSGDQSPYRVRCTGAYTALRLDTRDLDDRAYIFSLELPSTLDGGDGEDDVEFFADANTPATLNGGPGNDEMYSGEGVQTLNGGAGSDVLEDYGDQDSTGSTDDNDTLNGDAGADTRFRGGAGDDTFNGGSGNDIFTSSTVGEAGVDTYNGGAGFDQIDFGNFGGTPLTLTQNGVADDGPTPTGARSARGGPTSSDLDNIGGDIEQIEGASEDDTIVGGAVDNVLIGNGGRDTITGGAGRDTLLGDSELSIIFGGGGGAGDVLNGGDGDDSLAGDVGEDTLNGDGGSDVLDGGVEPDELNGGGGVDTVDYDLGEVEPDVLLCLITGGQFGCAGQSVPRVTATIDNIADDGPNGEGDNIRTDIENVLTGDGGDRVVGSAAENLVSTGGGDDDITVRDASRDLVACGPGFDRVVADRLDVVETQGEDRCESVDLPPEPAQPAQPTQTAQPTQPSQPTVLVAPVSRLKPRSMRITVSPRSDTSGERLFTTTGRLTPPSALSADTACASGGIVAVQIKAGSRTISTRRVVLRDDCTFVSRVTFSVTRRFGRATRLKFTARFAGNDRLERSTAPSKFARIRPAQ